MKLREVGTFDKNQSFFAPKAIRYDSKNSQYFIIINPSWFWPDNSYSRQNTAHLKAKSDIMWKS